MNASRFNPGTASKRWLRELGCARMDTVRPVPLQLHVALVLAVDPGLGARVTRTLSFVARGNVGFSTPLWPSQHRCHVALQEPALIRGRPIYRSGSKSSTPTCGTPSSPASRPVKMPLFATLGRLLVRVGLPEWWSCSPWRGLSVYKLHEVVSSRTSTAPCTHAQARPPTARPAAYRSERVQRSCV